MIIKIVVHCTRMVQTQKVLDFFVILFLLIFPFTFVLGRIVPFLVLLPFYISEIILFIIGVLLLFNREGKQWTPLQKYCMIFLILFFCLGIFSILQHVSLIQKFIAEHPWSVTQQSLFKKLISSDITETINKTLMIFVGIILFVAIRKTELRKERILQLMLFPLFLIILVNIFLVIFQTDISLDGGKEGYFIHPYGLVETGRAYFPFVNATLLSFYLSCMFFVVLYFFSNGKDVQWKKYCGILLFLIPIIILFTKSRTAIGVVFLLYLFFLAFLFLKKRIIIKRDTLLFCLGIFLFLLTLFTFIFHQYSFVKMAASILNSENTSEMEDESLQEELEKNKQLLEDQYVSDFHNRRSNYHWPTALVLFEQHPFLGIGTGLFYYSVLYEEKQALCDTITLCPDSIQPTDRSSTAHSIYFQILAENGIIGISVFLAFLSLLLYGLTKEVHKNKDTLFFLLIIIAMLIQGIFFSYFEYPQMWYLFLVFVGLSVKKE